MVIRSTCARWQKLEDKQILALRTELYSNRPNGSGTNKIVGSRSATPCQHQEEQVECQNLQPLGRLFRQSRVFLNLPTMQQPEAYVGHADDEYGKLVSDGTRKILLDRGRSDRRRRSERKAPTSNRWGLRHRSRDSELSVRSVRQLRSQYGGLPRHGLLRKTSGFRQVFMSSLA